MTDLAQLAAAEPGTTVALSGVLGDFKPRSLPPGLTLDLRKATIKGDWWLRDVTDLTLIGGKWTGGSPLRLNDCGDIDVRNPIMRGPEAREGVGIAAYDVEGLKVMGGALAGFRNGLLLSGVRRFEVAGSGFCDMAADGIQGVACWDGWLHHLVIHGSRKATGTEHSDGIQMRSDPGRPPTSDILIEHVEAFGEVQGVIFTNKAGGGFDRVTIRNVRASVAYPRAISVVDGRGVTVTDCHVSSYPGARWPARIVTERCTSVAKARNTVD